LQDWLVDPSSPLNWRLRQETAGSGALGDIGAHIIDLAQFVTGQTITAVSGVLDTFIRERPVAAGSAQVGPVTVDDTAFFTARFGNGALGTFTATRLAPGHGNGMGLAVDGTTGSIAFDFPAMNELRFLDGTLPAEEAGTRTITVTDSSHPYLRAWWPAGHVLGYEHTFTHEIYDFLTALGSGIAPAPSFADGLQVQRVLDAVAVSARTDSRMTSVSGG
jgi:predicted dehydrogenase